MAHHGKAHLRHETHLLPLGGTAQFVADEVKGQELQTAFPALSSIQLADAARRQIPGVGVGLGQGLVEFLEILPADDTLAAHLQGFGAGNDEGHIPHNLDGVGDILTFEAVAPGDGLYQLAAFIPKHQGETVQLPAQHHLTPANELKKFIHRLGLASREHRFGVGNGGQALQHLAGHPLGRRTGQDDPGLFLQPRQLFIERVILSVGQDGGVLTIVGFICLLELGNQSFHFVDHVGTVLL